MQIIGVTFWYLHLIALVSVVSVIAFGWLMLLLTPGPWRPYVLAFLIGVAVTLAWSTSRATTEIGGGTYSGQPTQGEPNWECVHNEHHRCG